MKVAITGAAGGIGSVLSDLLWSNGISTILIDDLSSGSLSNFSHEENGKFLVRSDLKNEIETLHLVSDCSYIVHLAATSSLSECQLNPLFAIENNVGITSSIIRLATLTGAKIIFASTGAIYEKNTVFPFKEKDPVSPLLTYPQSKYFSEQMLNSARVTNSIEYVALRFFNVFGPRQNFHRTNPPLINYLVREIVMNQIPTLYAPLSQIRDYVYVGDIAELILNLLKSNDSLPNEAVNVCSGVGISISEIVSSLAEAIGKQIEFNKGEPEDLWEKNHDLFSGRLPFQKSEVKNETLKTSIGDPSYCLATLGWKARTNILSQIQVDMDEMIETVLKLKVK
jgi:nucleoside-diphosphate-sugar epimerase